MSYATIARQMQHAEEEREFRKLPQPMRDVFVLALDARHQARKEAQKEVFIRLLARWKPDEQRSRPLGGFLRLRSFP